MNYYITDASLTNTTHHYVVNEKISEAEVAQNILSLSQIINVSDVILLSQIHSSIIHVVDEIFLQNSNRSVGDCLITNLRNIAIGVQTADCVPILIRGRNYVCSIHCGWRGAISDLIPKAIQILKSYGECNLNAIIGPHIHKKSYTVQQDLFQTYIAESLKNKQFFTNNGNGFNFDLGGYVIAKLQKNNVCINRIYEDTYTSDIYFSYRKSIYANNTHDTRRILSMIWNT